jgi:hypothetical protein
MPQVGVPEVKPAPFFCQFAGSGKNYAVLAISCTAQSFYIAFQDSCGATAPAVTGFLPGSII